MKKIFTLLCTVLFASGLFAATEPAWYNDVTSISNNGQYYIYSVNGKGFMQAGQNKVKAVNNSNYTSKSDLLFTVTAQNDGKAYNGSNYVSSYQLGTCGPVGSSSDDGSKLIWTLMNNGAFWNIHGHYNAFFAERWAALYYQDGAYSAKANITGGKVNYTDNQYRWYLISPAQYDRHFAIYFFDAYKESLNIAQYENHVPAAYYTALQTAYNQTFSVQNAAHSAEVVNAAKTNLETLYNGAADIAAAYATATAAINALEAIEDKGEDFAEVTADITNARTALEQAMSEEAVNAAVAGLKAIDPITFTVTTFMALEALGTPASTAAGRAITYDAADKTIINAAGQPIHKGTTTLTATAAATNDYYKFVRSAQVTVNALPTSAEENKTITYGAAETWNGYDLSTYAVGSHSLVYETTNAQGGVHTITLTLTVNKIATLNVPVELAFCAGGSETYRGVEYSEAGTFNVPAEGATRDTVYNVTVTILQPTFGTDSKTFVYGAQESWNGIDLSEYTVGTHQVPFVTTNAVGCDSTVTLNLTVNKMSTLEVPVELEFCVGGSETYRGVEYSEAGTFNVPAEGATRDTVYNVTVTILQPTFGTDSKTIVYGAQESWNGIDLSEYTVGTHQVPFVTTNAAGCDSTVTLNLTVNKMATLEVPETLEFCVGGSANYRGVEYTEAGTFNVPAEGATRDTVYVVTVNVLQPTTGTDTKTIVVGAEESWNGIALKDSTVGVHYVEFVTTNVAGCDSTVTLTLTVNKMDTLEVYYPIDFCAGDSAEYRGKWYYEYALDTIYAEGDVRDTIIYVEAMLLPTTDLLVLYDTIVSGNEVILPEGEWVIGEDTVSGTYPTVESEDASELIFHQYFDEPVVCGPNYIELVVTVTPKEQKPGDTTTDIEDVLDAQKAEKVLIDGVLYIRRGEKVYTASGELVK